MCTPDISVILPAFNRQATIQRALQSVVGQVGVRVELILIDDGSNDDTFTRAISFLSSQDNGIFQTIQMGENTGASRARNAGLDVARGRYVAFLDSDDEFAHPNVLHNWVAHGDAGGLDLVAAPFVDDVAGRPIKRRLIPPEPITDAEAFPSVALLQSFWQLLFRRAFLEAHNLRFRPELKRREDWPFLVPALLAARKIGFLEDPVLIYHHDAHNAITKVVTREALSYLIQNIRAVAGSFERAETDTRNFTAFRAIKTAKYYGQAVCIWGELVRELASSDDRTDRRLLRSYAAALSELSAPLPDYRRIDAIATSPGAFFDWPETAVIREVFEQGQLSSIARCVETYAPLRKIVKNSDR